MLAVSTCMCMAYCLGKILFFVYFDVNRLLFGIRHQKILLTCIFINLEYFGKWQQ